VLGTYRFILASLVIVNHLWFDNPAGAYSVNAFYVISGYLMTAILHERYGFSPSGLGRYFANRVLRIYPAYLTFFGATLLMVTVFPWVGLQLYRSIREIASVSDWIQNLSIIGMRHKTGARLIPQAWSLDIELWFYLLMGLFLSRTKKTAVVWLGLSLFWTGWAVFSGADFEKRQLTLMAGSLPFSLGAVIWFFKEKLPSARAWAFLALFGLFLINAAASHFSWIDPLVEGYYISILIGAFSVVVLVRLDTAWMGGRFRSLDKLMGDLSYPMYVGHFLAGILILLAFWPNVPQHRGFDFFILSYGLTLILSYGVHRWMERPIERVRTWIKSSLGRKAHS